MNITVLGATGMAGTAIVLEAARRGHQVTAAARRPHPTTDRLVTRQRHFTVVEQDALGG